MKTIEGAYGWTQIADDRPIRANEYKTSEEHEAERRADQGEDAQIAAELRLSKENFAHLTAIPGFPAGQIVTLGVAPSVRQVRVRSRNAVNQWLREVGLPLAKQMAAIRLKQEKRRPFRVAAGRPPGHSFRVCRKPRSTFAELTYGQPPRVWRFNQPTSRGAENGL